MANHHIRIYASIRTEAYNANRDSTRLQLDDYCVHLRYTKDEIRSIFFQNIDNTGSEKLTAPSREDRIERFLGRRSIPHRFARDSSGQPREEDLFDYIYRHTFARPREIVLMGLELSKVQASLRNLATIVERVNSTAAVLFEQYKREVVPYFDDGLFEFFCERARQNVIPHATAYQIYCQARDERGFEHICSYFWRLGLLGLVEATPRGDAGDTAYIQRFLPVAERSLLGELVPDYPDYYLVHPAVDRAFRSIVGSDLWSVDNIIGYDYPFSPPQQNGKAILHAHYGLDRDSLGVVLPALAANASIAVVQPSDGRQALLGSATTLVLRMNGAELLTFKVISERSTPNEIERVMREWLAGNNILVYGNQIDVTRRIMARASSMSTCTSGIDLTTGLLRHIGHSSETLNTCHVFERTPKPSDTERIQRYFRSLKLPNATVVPVLVDRFVHSIDLAREGDRAIFETTTEVSGKLVTSVNHSGLLGGSALLHPTRSKAAQRFAGHRQQYLLEGSYKLCKIARSKHGESVLLASNKIWCTVFDIFFHIQIARALRRIPFRQWSAIFGQKEDSRVRNEMLEYCRAIKSRVVAIPKSYLSQFRRSEIATAKRDGFLPSDEEFYSLSRESALFPNTRAVNRLRELLRYDYRKDRRSVFISYSFKDHPFVRRFGDALIKRGVRVFYFQKDDPQKTIAAAMRDGVSSSDRLLFVASKHSLRSRACHYELTICRDRVGRDLGHQLLAIRLDNAVLNSTESDFSGEAGRAEMWKNILYLREQNITDWSVFRNRTDSAAFEDKLDSLVDQSLARD
jgi:TIR domain